MASPGLRPRMVVSTLMSSSAAPLGFSAKSLILPVASIFISPKSEALFSSQGMAATVMSAFVSLCFCTNFM